MSEDKRAKCANRKCGWIGLESSMRLARLPIRWRPAAEYNARHLHPAGKARAVRRAIQRAHLWQLQIKGKEAV